MHSRPNPSPLRVLLPVGLGTCLSLLGDASIYAVLPTHTMDAGVAIASLGILLSANRFIRLLLNGPAGIIYDRAQRRHLFVSALFIGAVSTALYGLTQGFWPLLVGRLLWGVAWVGIWIGGNTIVLDISRDDTRGRWVGLYHVSFFLGAAGGALLGGILTDQMGYHQAMIICFSASLFGAFFALIFLPETRGQRQHTQPRPVSSIDEGRALGAKRAERTMFAATVGLYSIHRLAVAGVLQSTFGLFLLGLLGAQVEIAGRTLGVATLTGLGLGLATLISATSAPIIGGISDRVGDRWRVAAGGLVPGIAGFSLLSVGIPLATLFGLPLVAITGGSNQGLSTVLIGDLGNVGRQSRQLGVLFTAGDLASAIGPPLAYALVSVVGAKNVYGLLAGLFLCAFVTLLWVDKAIRRSRVTFSSENAKSQS